MFFVHGLRVWSRPQGLALHTEVICCSLHRPGWTTLLRPFGYILEPLEGSVVASYPVDVCSRTERGNRLVSPSHRNVPNCGMDWGRLIALTPEGRHNEVWVRGGLMDIVGFYVAESAPGSRVFRQACLDAGLTSRADV